MMPELATVPMQALDTAQHHHHEGIDHIARAHFRRDALQRRDHRAGEAGEAGAIGKVRP